jgi:DNA-binding transcriptional LysR family regulator
MQLSDRIGRRLKLHDLHVLMAVVQSGGMGKAARRLNTSQPAISRSIAELEHALGVRLLDRSRQGIAPTEYGRALLDCGTAVFDELQQGVKNIEFLADPALGRVTIGGDTPMIAGLIPAVIGRLRRRYPRMDFHVVPVVGITEQQRALRERTVDLVIGRLAQSLEEQFDVEVLFRDRTYIVINANNPLGRRRRIKLSELIGEPWSVPPPDTAVGAVVAEAFRAEGLDYPPRGVVIGSIHLQVALLANGPFLGIFSGSMLRFGTMGFPFKVLPVELRAPLSPVGIVTLKGRTHSPATRRFIDCARELVLAKKR